MALPGPGHPGGEEAGSQAEKTNQPQNGKSASRPLGTLLGESLLIGPSIGSHRGAGVDDLNPATAPKIFVGHRGFGDADHGTVDLIQSFDRKLHASLAIGAVLVGRQGSVLELAKGLSLTDSLSAGGTRLGDLPKESPKDQAQVPAPVTGIGALVLLGQAMGADPGAK